MPIFEKILTDREIKKLTRKKLNKILRDRLISSVSKLELLERIEKINPHFFIKKFKEL